MSKFAIIISTFPTWRDIERLARSVELLARARGHHSVDAIHALRAQAFRRKFYRPFSAERKGEQR